jgi:hypothetical protein
MQRHLTREATVVTVPTVVASPPRPAAGQCVEDGLDRADRFAGTAVHALGRADVERPVALVDAVHWAFDEAGSVRR